ncbi:hypothetical protein HPB47_023015 [Ixodes persulcatus]|uniref:Uncharacterized protein n=1 Tax=Ixodes persulcatus TaxID=34615 RepID=A0AC60Q999_IXOPE|nr:hypothetical protein HPB47_023015 [Ixodes persulcatus]
METIKLTTETPEVDRHLLYLWEARYGLIKRWKRQKLNRKLKKRIATIMAEALEAGAEVGRQGGPGHTSEQLDVAASGPLERGARPRSFFLALCWRPQPRTQGGPPPGGRFACPRKPRSGLQLATEEYDCGDMRDKTVRASESTGCRATERALCSEDMLQALCNALGACATSRGSAFHGPVTSWEVLHGVLQSSLCDFNHPEDTDIFPLAALATMVSTSHFIDTRRLRRLLLPCRWCRSQPLQPQCNRIIHQIWWHWRPQLSALYYDMFGCLLLLAA